MRQLNIVLAEDNRGDVLLVREALETHGIDHNLVILPDGARAVDYLGQMGLSPAAPCPDVLLLDLNLPKIDGHRILEQFRKHPMCQHVPVVVVTSSDVPRDRERVMQLGATRYFRKPTGIDEFMELGAVVKEVMQDLSS